MASLILNLDEVPDAALAGSDAPAVASSQAGALGGNDQPERRGWSVSSADLTQDCVRAGSFTSVAELVEAVTAYLACRNENPKLYKWKADGAKTLAKIQRGSGGS